MPRPSIPADRSDYLEQLVAIRKDPRVEKLARTKARDPDLAEDVLQEAYYAMATMKHPEHIEDLRKYFCTVVVRMAYRLRGQSRAVAIVDVAAVADTCARKLGGEALPPPFDEAIITKLLARQWLRFLADQGTALICGVPSRSAEPDRYRVVVATTAVWMLRAIVRGDFKHEDLNLTLRAAFREWFAEDGVPASNTQQRLSRGRADIGDLLKTVISRDELRS